MISELKKHWLLVGVVCALALYAWRKQTNTATNTNATGGATP
jgi:hypothetical protein